MPIDLRFIDPNNLWDTTVVSDRTAGEILIHTPIQASGDVDAVRQQQYQGRCALNGPQGQLTLTFDLKATTLQEACAAYPAALKAALDDMEAQAMRQRIAGAARVPPRKPQ
jgi:hypothetical protein